MAARAEKEKSDGRRAAPWFCSSVEEALRKSGERGSFCVCDGNEALTQTGSTSMNVLICPSLRDVRNFRFFYR